MSSWRKLFPIQVPELCNVVEWVVGVRKVGWGSDPRLKTVLRLHDLLCVDLFDKEK